MKLIFLSLLFCFQLSKATDIDLDRLYLLRHSTVVERRQFVKSFDWIINDYKEQQNDNEFSYISFIKGQENNGLTIFYNYKNTDTRIFYSFTDSAIYFEKIANYLNGYKPTETIKASNGFMLVYEYVGDIVTISITKPTNTYIYNVWIYSLDDYNNNNK